MQQQEQAEPISQSAALQAKSLGNPDIIKFSCYPSKSSNLLTHLLVGSRLLVIKLNPYITNSSACNCLSFIGSV